MNLFRRAVAQVYGLIFGWVGVGGLVDLYLDPFNVRLMIRVWVCLWLSWWFFFRVVWWGMK